MNYQIACRVLTLSLFSIVITACGHKADDSRDARQAIRVKTITVTDNNVKDKALYSGTVEEGNGTAVSFSTGGTIKSLTVSEGDKVAKGQLIGTLDNGSLRSAYDIAAATLAQAKDAYNRMKLLHDANSLPDIKWVDVQSKLTQAQKTAEIARIALNDARLYSPVSGVVSEKMASAGQNVAPGIPVVKIVNINNVKVMISIPENEISKFNNNSTASITTKAVPDEIFSGKLIEKAVTANPLSRAYQVKYQVDNSAGKLLPGMICDVTVAGSSSLSGIVLPVGAVLLAADNSNFVWLDSAGVAVKRTVVPAAMLPEGIMIESGLNHGDKVIVAGMDKVSRGTKVTSIN